MCMCLYGHTLDRRLEVQQYLSIVMFAYYKEFEIIYTCDT